MWMSDAGMSRAFCFSPAVIYSRIASWAKRPSLERDNTLAAHLTATAYLVGGFAMSSGIYQITNLVNGKCYIGSAVNLKNRQAVHFSALRKGQHHNQHLQRAFDKYGETAFLFSILERVEDSEQLIVREQHYLDMLSPNYNISPIAGSTLGFRFSSEMLQKRRAWWTADRRRARGDRQRGKSPSAETRAKMSAALRGRPLSEEHKRKLSGERNHNYGKHLSAETKRKLSVANTGKHHSNETRKKISETLMGHTVSEETRRKIRASLTGQPFSEERCRNISIATTGKRHRMYGKHHSEKTRRKISIAQKARWRRVRAAKNQEQVT